MGNQVQAEVFKLRFPPFSIFAIYVVGRAWIMGRTTETVTILEGTCLRGDLRARGSERLWQRWYAKLWWTAIAFYWSGKAGSYYSPALDKFYTSALAGFLNVAFFPPLALMVLGLGFARAWCAGSDWEFVEPTHEQMFPKRSVGGMRDPASDPLDPRSGALHRRNFHRQR